MSYSSQYLKLKNTNFELFEGGGSYVSCMRTYLAYFGEIPSIKRIHQIKHQSARDWVEKQFRNDILRIHLKEKPQQGKKSLVWVNVIYVIKDDIIIDIEDDGVVCVLHNQVNIDKAEEIISRLSQFKKLKKKSTEIGLIVSSTGGVTVLDSKIRKPKLRIHKHYNDDLLPVHNSILKCLRAKNKNGLILLYGEPGTGKSTYIRYLIHCQNKRVIFMPTGIARSLESPELLSLLVDNQNSILVIEDAEELLISRDNNPNSGISMLLNLTDGLLGESLNIQVICTFNTQLENIDKALLRKGRLMAMYDFKALTPDKANQLLSELNAGELYTSKPMTLAEIFNIRDTGYESLRVRKKKIGFAVA